MIPDDSSFGDPRDAGDAVPMQESWRQPTLVNPSITEDSYGHS
jgi:hypothetical protein